MKLSQDALKRVYPRACMFFPVNYCAESSNLWTRSDLLMEMAPLRLIAEVSQGAVSSQGNCA